MKRWYDIPDEDKRIVFNQIFEKVKLPPFAVEKDWWVVQTLAIVFEMEVGPHLIFKGGTSLSKAWGLIERFSEDIDLAIAPSFLGFNEELNSRGKITRLRKASSQFLAKAFLPELEKAFVKKGLTDVKFKLVEAKDSDQDPRIIEIYYPNVIPSPGYIQPRVQLEIGCRSLREPYTPCSIISVVDEHYPNTPFAQQGIQIPCVNPERTLLEKIFLLHEEYQRPVEKMRVERLSRHLYDIYQLSKTPVADKALADKELYETIVHHRFKLAKLGGVDYNLHQPQTIRIVPDKTRIDEWKKDYNTMQEQMIYGDSPSFKDLIAHLEEFTQKVNAITWTIEGNFPNPKAK